LHRSILTGIRLSAFLWVSCRFRFVGATEETPARRVALPGITSCKELTMFEALESRRLLAGNVVAALSGDGTLSLTGDAANNIIAVATSGTDIVVTGSATAVNGVASVSVPRPRSIALASRLEPATTRPRYLTSA
jgi:hypothetical protein